MDSVVRHYGLKSLEERILAALADAGKDPQNLTLADLAPVDEFHIRGKNLEEQRLIVLQAALTSAPAG